MARSESIVAEYVMGHLVVAEHPSEGWPYDEFSTQRPHMGRLQGLSRCCRRPASYCPRIASPEHQSGFSSASWSVQTVKLRSVSGPNDVLIATSTASRPRASSTRPTRGTLLRASNVYHWPPRYASNQPAKSIGP